MTMRNLRTLVASMSASLDEQSLTQQAIVVDAPHGMMWAATRSHSMRFDFWDTAKADAINDIAQRMHDGTTACTDHDCDVCHA